MQNPGKPHLDALLQVFQYLKSTTLLGLSYKRQTHHDLQLQGWCDGVMLTTIVIKIQDIQQQVISLP